jgi:hypothetical protein
VRRTATLRCSTSRSQRKLRPIAIMPYARLSVQASVRPALER